ncbi:hypothetical protein BJV74DRAFT_891833 [Russula compacta]|nr:hypothetical protein BJV74DRAFT_891833 [Russula compacta]
MKAHIDLLGYSDSDGDYIVEAEQLEPQPEAMKKKPSGSEQSAVSSITEAMPFQFCRKFNNADEWEPQAGATAKSQSSELEEDMDLEDEELDTLIKKKKKSSKKQKAGVGMRDCINKAVAGLTQRDISLNLKVQKQKAGSNSEVGARPTPRKAWKTKGSEVLSGLVSGWKKIINVTSQPTGTTHTSAKSTATISHPPSSMVSTSTTHSRHTAFTAMSIHQANSSAPSATNWCDEPGPSVGPNDRPTFTYGGLPSDEEEVRRQDPKLVNKHQSITRVHKIHTSPLHTKAKGIIKSRIPIFHLTPLAAS